VLRLEDCVIHVWEAVVLFGDDELLIIHGFMQIIGRVHADPDYLPRSSDFGLNQHVFREKFCCQCPEPFYRVAFLCCDLNPDKR
jgi:hypothetical protein